jgi:hypothetical protein
MPQWLAKLQALVYHHDESKGNSIDPQLSNLVHAQNWNRSMSVMTGTASNFYDWDRVVELENVPVSGQPEKVSQQYVLVQVNQNTYTQFAQAVRQVALTMPTAYGVPQSTTTQTGAPVYQVPRAQAASVEAQATSGTTFFQWIKNQLVGQQNGGS